MSTIFDITPYQLDDIFWDNSDGDNSYNKPFSEIVRNEKLDYILSQDKWIIEGTYYDWLSKSFQQADVIIIFNSNVFLRDYRIIKRFLLTKLYPATYKKESIGNLLHMLRWNHHYETRITKEILEYTNIFVAKRYHVNNFEQIIDLIGQQVN